MSNLSFDQAARLVSFLDRVEADVYPEELSEPHMEITRRAFERLRGHLQLGPATRVLDVGCGQGPAFPLFHSVTQHVVGVTLSEVDVEACRAQGYDVRRMDQSFLAFENESFDVIWARHVVEHSIMPLFTLHGFRAAAKPGGILYLEVPAPDTDCHHENNPNHYSVLTKSSWRSLLGRSGFSVIEDVAYRFVVPAGNDCYWGFFCRAVGGCLP